MPHTSKIGILVADGGNARILERESATGALRQLHHLCQDHASNHEHGPDRPGRGFGNGGGLHHAYEPETDWHENQKDVFAQGLITLLKKTEETTPYHEWYIVAPPHMLGSLRQCLQHAGDKLAEKITHELGKDVTHSNLEELGSYLTKAVQKN